MSVEPVVRARVPAGAQNGPNTDGGDFSVITLRLVLGLLRSPAGASSLATDFNRLEQVVPDAIWPSGVIPHGFFQLISVFVNLINGGDCVPNLIFLLVEYSEVFLTSVEVKATNRFTIVVVQQNAKITLGVSLNDSFGIDNGADDSADDVIALKLFKRCQDFIF